MNKLSHQYMVFLESQLLSHCFCGLPGPHGSVIKTFPPIRPHGVSVGLIVHIVYCHTPVSQCVPSVSHYGVSVVSISQVEIICYPRVFLHITLWCFCCLCWLPGHDIWCSCNVFPLSHLVVCLCLHIFFSQNLVSHLFWCRLSFWSFCTVLCPHYPLS